MKKTTVFLIIIMCALTMLACNAIPKSIKNSFTYCHYNGKYTGIDTLINIDGYYEEMSINKWPCTKTLQNKSGYYIDTVGYDINTAYLRFMFYDNGLIAYNINDRYYDDRKKEHIKKDISSFLKDFFENSEAPGANYFYGNEWGSYIICGDTIKVQGFYRSMSLNDGWGAWESWYKVIDQNTIERINSFSLPEKNEPSEASLPPPFERIGGHLPTFIPIPVKPPSDKSWILKEKWFWCDEDKWKNFMNGLPDSKRRRK